MVWVYCARHNKAYINETELCLQCDKEEEWIKDGLNDFEDRGD